MMINDQGIRSGSETIGWDDVREVAIRTTADGPFADDVFWVFALREGVIEIPSMFVDGAGVAALQAHLPHLDNLKLIAAMGSAEERIFRVWHAEQHTSAWHEETYAKRFATLVERLGGQSSREVFERLRDAWSTRERRYHDLEHLTDCLRELDGSSALRETADIVELALWYHDAVYAIAAKDNEERSAELLLADARAMGIPEARALAAAECVRATAHLAGALPSGSAAELTVDIDLAILGREPLRFMDYEYAIAEEYALVSHARFIVGRRQFLQGMLARETIFRTEHFRGRYEAAARRNITGLLASPRYRAHRLLGWAYGLFGRA